MRYKIDKSYIADIYLRRLNDRHVIKDQFFFFIYSRISLFKKKSIAYLNNFIVILRKKKITALN